MDQKEVIWRIWQKSLEFMKRQSFLIRKIPIYREMFSDGKEVYMGRTLEEFQYKIRNILSGELPSLQNSGYRLVRQKDIRKIGMKLQSIYEEVEV
jgi:1,2-diacylglycerol-3-alpha-glucose alpha-1,2-glucosyltransferase